MATVTDGQANTLSTIYERLRKRSFRALKYQGALAPWEELLLFRRDEDEKLHLSYLAGVRDALNAVNTSS